MLEQQTAAQLQQFICTTNWMRNSIPNYSQIVAPLRDLLEVCFKKTGSRTKKVVHKVSLTGLWGTNHTHAWKYI